jgi:phosphonate transport system permease protein
MSIPVPTSALPSHKRRVALISFAASATLTLGLFWYLKLSPASFVVDGSYIVDLFNQFFPPKLSLFWTNPALWLSLADTLSMAFLATVCGGAIALCLAFFAAANTTPHPLLRLAVRTLLMLQRSIPSLIIVLVLLIAVGIGPFAGFLTLTIASSGMFGRFFADSIEQVDNTTAESVQSVGGTRTQTIRYAILPQVIPSFIANLFYAFDNNLRAAIPLGVFGGGGLGFELQVAHGLLHYHDVLAYTILVIVMIAGMERLSDAARRTILTQPLQAARSNADRRQWSRKTLPHAER